MEKITRVGRIRSMRKEVVGFFQYVIWKKNFLVRFEYMKKKEIPSCLIVYFSEKEEVEMEESILHLPEK